MLSANFKRKNSCCIARFPCDSMALLSCKILETVGRYFGIHDNELIDQTDFSATKGQGFVSFPTKNSLLESAVSAANASNSCAQTSVDVSRATIGPAAATGCHTAAAAAASRNAAITVDNQSISCLMMSGRRNNGTFPLRLFCYLLLIRARHDKANNPGENFTLLCVRWRPCSDG